MFLFFNQILKLVLLPGHRYRYRTLNRIRTSIKYYVESYARILVPDPVNRNQLTVSGITYYSPYRYRSPESGPGLTLKWLAELIN